MPQVTELAWELRKEGVPLPEGILTTEEFTEGHGRRAPGSFGVRKGWCRIWPLGLKM